MAGTAEIGTGSVEQTRLLEFAPREVFLVEFSSFVDSLTTAQNALETGQTSREAVVAQVQENLSQLRASFGAADYELFRSTGELFSLASGLPPHLPETTAFLTSRGVVGRLTVEMAGPPGVGKTTLARFLSRQIGASLVQEKFGPADNPFWALAYTDPGLMFRSQLAFLLGNIQAGLGEKYLPGRWVKDTSVWSDIFVFMQQKSLSGKVSPRELQTYLKLVGLLGPLMVKPDLLVMLQPLSPAHLGAGLNARLAAEPERAAEAVITSEDLALFCRTAVSAVKELRERGVNVLEVPVDPPQIYSREELRYAEIYRIRGELGLLKELLVRDPQEVARQIVGLMARSREGLVVIVHSKSMFAGKTRAVNLVVEMLRPEFVLAFQPRAAVRYGEVQERSIMDRDGGKTGAMIIENNCLSQILAIINQQQITPQQKPVIVVDEAMFCSEGDQEKAVEAIEELRGKGFCLVFTGISYTFQETLFPFMDRLLTAALTKAGWYGIEVETRCKYCAEPAAGTRRLRPDGTTADFSDETFQAGDNYEPVCCQKHPSCLNQPPSFIRPSLPKKQS